MTLREHIERLRKSLADFRLGNPSFADLERAARGQLERLGGVELGGLTSDLAVALAFYTRLPIRPQKPVDDAALARASWCLPIVGALIGVIAGFAYWISVRLNMPQLVAATIAVAASMMLTGCLHENGLAGTADRLGGGMTPERALDIMREHRIGTFGACALIVSFALRVGAITDLPKAGLVAWALIGAHAMARAGLPLFMRLVPPAGPDGLAAQAGAPPPDRAWAALVIGAIMLWTALGFTAALFAIVFMLLGNAVVALISHRKIGGQTGDVRGAAEQVGECIVLMTTAARF
ncbi:MAG TPA: adenosylcobinamide-GDP ribazoletransferase [Xanthobacteraceae bacterium]|jgi:adenosylcobinamide-GDP ribazoletransferase